MKENKKTKMQRTNLLNTVDVWNGVISALSEHDYSTENKVAYGAFTVFQYYSEMESGGHESLLRWTSEHIEAVGITRYMEELISFLEKIDAHEYAMIEKKYGQEMWRLYVALDNNEIDEEEFYNVIEKADNEYYQLNEKIFNLLETYFLKIYTDLIEVVDN